MIQADPGLVNALDKQKNTPVMDAAFLGRAMIVKELIENAAEVTQKNADLMNPLQLACVNEGAGNGDVVAALIEALADPSDMCWQTTPLMAAADSGHIWALHALIDLGSDPWQMNGSGFTALDYARDMETAEFLYGLMEGDKLSDKAAPRIDTSKLFKDAEARRARLHRAAPQVSLEDAFATLEAPREWLPGFRATGEHFNDLRKAWRRICLRCHPDKQPEDLEEEAAAEWTAQFQAAVAAFEAIDKHFRSVCQDEELLPEVLQVLADHHLLDGKVVPSRLLSPVVSHCLFVLGCEGVDLGVQRGMLRAPTEDVFRTALRTQAHYIRTLACHCEKLQWKQKGRDAAANFGSSPEAMLHADLLPLLRAKDAKGDEGGDLFANLLHLQKHRRGRGLTALCRTAEAGKLTQATLTHFAVPLSTQAVLQYGASSAAFDPNYAEIGVPSLVKCLAECMRSGAQGILRRVWDASATRV
ncbi:Tnks2 [Symbiodinium sp. KB8]|nr:Tnks2 [Symbiodinium sp. KB8]